MVKSLSPAQNRGLEKGGEGRRRPLYGGRHSEKGALIYLPSSRGSFPFIWPLLLGGLTDWEMRKWKGCEDKRKGEDGRKEAGTLPEARRQGMQSTTSIQEPVLRGGMVSPDRQHFRVQAELRNLPSTRPQEEDILRKGLATKSTCSP